MARAPPACARTDAARDPGDTEPGWHVYLLRCGDGSLYAGATNNLAARLARHAAGKGARYTRARLPVALVYREPAADRSAALRREAALKRLRRAEKLALVERASARRGRPSAARAGRGANSGISAHPEPFDLGLAMRALRSRHAKSRDERRHV